MPRALGAPRPFRARAAHVAARVVSAAAPEAHSLCRSISRCFCPDPHERASHRCRLMPLHTRSLDPPVAAHVFHLLSVEGDAILVRAALAICAAIEPLVLTATDMP
eukprot:3795910-Prymnesium_polylepis.1